MAKYYKGNYQKNYNRNGGNVYYEQRDPLLVGNARERKRIRWRNTIIILLVSATLLGLTYFLTGGFYSKNVQSWEMQSGWYSSYDVDGSENGAVYVADNGLVSRDNYAVKAGGKTLTVYADFSKAAKIEVNERAYLRYNVVYYKGDQAVGQSDGYYIPYDIDGEEDTKAVIWSYSEALEDPEFAALEIDSVKLAIFHEDTGKKITAFNRAEYINVLTVLYE